MMSIELEAGKNDTAKNVVCSETSISYTRKNTTESSKKVTGHGRGTMPSHLPIVDITIEPDEDTSEMEKIGEEVSWYYEMDKPASLKIIRTTRPKYSRPQKTGIAIGKLPPLPVDKGNAGPGLIAHIINDKYIYHLPLDRQRRKFGADYKVEFSESFLSD